MSSSVFIVRLVPNPLAFWALRPDRKAAALAAGLHTAGIRASVLDLGTLEFVSQLLSRDVLARSPVSEADGSDAPRIDFATRALSQYYLDSSRHALMRAFDADRPSAVVFVAGGRFEHWAAQQLSAELFASRAIQESHVLFEGNLLRIGAASSGLPAVLHAADDDVPHSAKGFAPDIYPALRDGTKILVFEIGNDREPNEPFSGLFVLIEETAALLRYYGTRAFHLGRSVTGGQLNHVASELIVRGAQLHYSANAAMADYPLELPPVLRTSGCVAASFVVGSGSQRLIDEYFGYPFHLTRAERTLRGCAQAGIYTRIELEYPCADDDFHTREESLRLVRRCMPHAVRIGLPRKPLPHVSISPWSPAGRRRKHLERAIERLGISASRSPEDALVAWLAGFAGRERQFDNYAAHLLATGDMDALGGLVESINNAACGRTTSAYWQVFGRDQHVVGN